MQRLIRPLHASSSPLFTCPRGSDHSELQPRHEDGSIRWDILTASQGGQNGNPDSTGLKVRRRNVLENFGAVMIEFGAKREKE